MSPLKLFSLFYWLKKKLLSSILNMQYKREKKLRVNCHSSDHKAGFHLPWSDSPSPMPTAKPKPLSQFDVGNSTLNQHSLSLS